MINLQGLLEALIAVPSVTPDDADCQAILKTPLSRMGFRIEDIPAPPVSNFWAVHGDSGPLLAFAGHTDVVPTGDINEWNTPPFSASVKGDLLYGRGACDMKGSLAAMIVAIERFLQQHPNHPGRLGLLITSGEEGAFDYLGTKHAMVHLHQSQQVPDYCIVGEPTAIHTVGDEIKIGRRGSVNGKITIHGKQGHIAYPQLAINPLHALGPVISALTTKQYDSGNAHFPPTSFQLSNVTGGTGADNVIPSHCELCCNFRFSNEVTAENLKQQVEDCVQHCLNHMNATYQAAFEWVVSGEPFLTNHGALIKATEAAISALTGQKTRTSTGGGTSDGRYIAPYGVEVIELGPCNASIHQINEHTSLSELETLSQIYQRICETLLLT